MTLSEKIEAIRQACIKVNPLKFNNPLRCSHGCVVEDKVMLADVLLAISGRAGYNGKCWMLDYDGLFVLEGLKKIAWNLRADDLTQQSEETLSFLYDILCS